MRFSATAPRRASTLVFFALLAAYVVWMLSLPAWPSQDGPVHMYYTHVLDTIFFHTTPLYLPFLYIKHLLPPYAVYYYTLLVFSHFVSLLTADRLVICLYLVSFALGFRYLASAVGKGFSRTSPLACILLLNWALGMGFVNYCLSLSFALWAMGLWLRFTEAPQFGKRIGFLCLLVLITLSHPVPLLIVLCFGGLDLVCRYLFAYERRKPARFLAKHRANVLTLGAGSLCLVYVKAFTVPHPLEQRTAVHGSEAHQILLRSVQIFTAKSLGLLYGHWWQITLYRGSLLLLLLAAAVCGALQYRRDRRAHEWTAASTCFAFFVVLGIALPFLPSDLSGAYYFSERLTVLLWIMALLAASSWDPDRSPDYGESVARRTAAGGWADIPALVFAMLVSALLLHLADASLRPLARRERAIAGISLPELAGKRVLVLPGKTVPKDFDHLAPAWNPYEWDSVAILRRNNGILENAPWLDSPIIPLAPTPALTGAWLPRLLANAPSELSTALGHTPALRQTFLDADDQVLLSPSREGEAGALPELLPASWSCTQLKNVTVELCGGPRSQKR